MNKIIPYIVSTITRQPRYLPEFEWHKKNWTSNICRFWELVAWRKYGIRREAFMDEFGNYTAYTWEAYFAHKENKLRAFFRELKFIKIPLPVFLSPDGFKINMFPVGYLFAIAIDATKTATGNTTTTVTSTSMTISGSSPVLMVAVGDQGGGAGDITGVQASFDSTPVSMIKVDNQGIISVLETALYGLYGAVTGTIKATRTSSGDRITINCASYSGVSSSTAIGSLTKTKGTGTAQGFTSTAITAPTNSWLVMGAYVHAGGGPADAGTGTTLRIEDTEVGYLFDSNGAVSGSQSLVVTDTGSHPYGYVICAIEVVASSAIKTVNGLAVASVKTVNGLAIASVKTINGLS